MGKATQRAKLAKYRAVRDNAMSCARGYDDRDSRRYAWVRVAREMNRRLVARIRAQH